MTEQELRSMRQGRRAFSLLEMLIVVAILGLIATLVFSRLGGTFGESKIKVTQTALANAAVAVERFQMDVGRYPNAEEGLSVLLEKPEDASNWNGPYFSKRVLPRDGWDRERSRGRPRHGR
ncbi:MAG: type II secretion system protein GspG [Actinomycetota bacterium]